MVKKNLKKKKKIALVFRASREFSFVLANTLVGLTRHNEKFWDDIIVYHDGIPGYEQKAIKSIVETQFIEMPSSEELAINDDTDSKKGFRSLYCKIECFRLLDEYHQVIWNDTNILVRNDISGLAEYGKNAGVALVLPSPQYVVGSSMVKLDEEYEVFSPLWNTEVMVLTDKLSDHEEMYKWCKETVTKHKSNLLWPDLAIINMALQRFNIDPEGIDPDEYACEVSSRLVDRAMIIHVDEDKAFWNNLGLMQKYSEWTQNAIKWSQTLYEYVKDKKPLVSCVMSCYERYEFLVDSINSVLAQTYGNIEIIMVIEKSGVQEKIEEVLRKIKDKRIRIIKNTKKLGFAASLNVGIDNARGEYIARSDDDDLCVPNRFSMQVKYMEEHKSIGILGGNMIVFGKVDTKFLAFSDEKYIKAATLLYASFMHPTVMMRKSMLDEYSLRYDPNYYTEDYELWSRAVYLFETANLPDYLMYYRLHESQASGVLNDSKIHESHKRVMRNQLEKQLGLNLTENEIETIQPRKDSLRKVNDVDGAFAIRERTIRKVLDANKERKAYDERALEYIINWGGPEMIDNVSEENEISSGKIKKGLKSFLKPILKPVYGRFISKMETIMVNHDEELRVGLQNQIDEIKKKSQKGENEE